LSAGTSAATLRRPRRVPAVRSLLRGRPEDAAWVRPSLIGLLVATLLLYVIGLGASGWANAYYSAAVQAGASTWKAFLFGSFDAANSITVDKPPASLWMMGLSARLFGVSSWSILVPQALEGVAAVGLLYAAVRRRFGAPAGLLAGAVLALTPVAVLMFRFNNPDALLTLALVAAAYAVTRALEQGRTGWLLLAGSLIGLGFLTKMLQALIVVPGFALVYLLAAPTSLWRRLWQLALSGLAVIVSAGWWVTVVALWPASSRPYIGSSQTNSILELIWGYNGLGRLSGNESGSVVGGGRMPGAGAWGPTGLFRLFGSDMGAQASWLIPAALLLGLAVLRLRGRAARTDGRRAAILLWGSWLVVTGLVFSFAQGIIHEYYLVVLGPAIGALVGAGAVECWRERQRLIARLAAIATIGVTAAWAFVLLDRTPAWHPWLRWAVVVAGAAACLLVLAPRLPGLGSTSRLAAGLAVVALLGAPAAYALETASTPHSGSLPTAGPAGASVRGGPGGFGPGRFRGGAPGFAGGVPPLQGGGSGNAGGGFGSRTPAGSGSGNGRGVAPGGGGLLDASRPSAALVKLLRSGSGSYRWVAATVGANSAAGFQLATRESVLAIGGFNGSDPSMTLARFQAYVRAGAIRWFIGGGGRGGGMGIGSSSGSTAIENWVASNFQGRTVNGITVYDLSSGRAP
jgi:4-amino-4-deoxy-L-arabinose transferase-like glycosyltransferase